MSEQAEECNFQLFSYHLDNDVAIFGAGWEDYGFGRVYILELVDSEWEQKQILTPNNETSQFGYSVAIAEFWIVVGAWDDIHIYHLQETNWQLHQIITSPNEMQVFGYFVGIGNNLVVVGALEPIPDGGYGALYLYELVDDKWYLADKVQPSAEEVPPEYPWFDHLSFDGSRVILGSEGLISAIIYQVVNTKSPVGGTHKLRPL